MKKKLFTVVILLVVVTILFGCTTIPALTPTATAPLVTPTQATPVTPTISPKATLTPQLKGLVLDCPILNGRAEIVDDYVDQSGTYRHELEWGKVVAIVMQRLPRVANKQNAVVEQVGNQNESDMKDVVIKQDSKVTAALSYPAWRLTYTTGVDKYVRKNVDIYIQTDNWDFRFGVSIPTASYNEYAATIEDWIAALTLVGLK